MAGEEEAAAAAANTTGEVQASSGSVLYWALNGHAVTPLNFAVNVFLILIAVSTVLLNGVTVDTLLRVRGEASSVGELLVACLALSDLLLGLCLLYTALYSLLHFQHQLECMVRFGLVIAAVIASALTFLALTLDRFFKITCPFRYGRICSKKQVAGVVGAVWLMALLLGLLPVMGWNNAALQQGLYAPSQTSSSSQTSSPPCSFFGILPAQYLQLFLGLCYVVMALVLLLYLAIFSVARRHARAIAALPGNMMHKGRNSGSHALNFTRTVCILVGFCFLCWLPMGLVCFLNFLGLWEGVSESRRGDFLLYASSAAFLNSLLNPAIYAAKIPAVRHRFRSLLCCRKFNSSEVTSIS